MTNLNVSGGKLGIGTTQPSAKLDIYLGNNIPHISFGDTATTTKASIRSSGGSSNSILNLQSATGIIELSDGSNAYKLDIYNAEALNIELQSNGSSFFRSGNLGIGTTTPTSLLEVGSNGYLQFSKTSSGRPNLSDCNSNNQRGRLVIDTKTNRLYICNGASREWDYIQLAD